MCTFSEIVTVFWNFDLWIFVDYSTIQAQQALT